jgi:energy-coupling factor transport system permease protein
MAAFANAANAASAMSARRARNLHPGAWWLWALGLAGAASRTTNPILLAALIAVAGFVVAARRSNAPWSMAYRAALIVGAFALVIHLIIEAVFGPPVPGTVLVTLPQLQLPSTFAGVRVGGPVTAEAMLGASYLGLQLAAILAALGAANALASPTRLLKSLPGAVYELGVAVVVALTVVPDSLAHLNAVRRARRLRGREDKGIRGVAASVGPVLHSALERSLGLAAAMDSRGYGRRRAVPRWQRRITGGLVLAGMLGVLLGVYALLDAALSTAAGLGVIGVAGGVALTGFTIAGRQVSHTVYRPDPWRAPEWWVSACGLFVALALTALATTDPLAMNPGTSPLAWPPLPLGGLLAVLVGGLPAWIAPPPVGSAQEARSRGHITQASVEATSPASEPSEVAA